MTETATLNSLWCTLLIEELVRNGIDYFCISPGSRSTPLTVAVARNTRARHILCIDERAAAFHALGFARATGQPAVLICTSGTAVANYLPALVEASVDCVPLLVLSADRPPELRQTGANQTIPQPHMFAQYVRWEFDLPCPDPQIAPSFVLTTADHAVARARSPVPGPVHLNCMFREPLGPAGTDELRTTPYCAPLRRWYETPAPYTHYDRPQITAPEAALAAVADLLASAQAPLIAIGRLGNNDEQRAVEHLLRSTGIPACADISSGLRLGAHHLALPFIDQILLSAACRAHIRPDVILSIGAQRTSKRLQSFFDEHSDIRHIVVKSHPFRQDPSHTATRHLHTDIAPFCRALAQRQWPRRPASALYTAATGAIERLLDITCSGNAAISEPAVATLISRHIPASHALFLSNSMPIRDMDMYATSTGARVPVGVNRGASGIDGIIASASGFAAGLQRPTTVVIGDLALLHDLNSLVLAAQSPYPLCILAVNNNGGGIFSFLPIAQHADVFEPYFGTPVQFDIAHAAAFAGLPFHRPATVQEVAATYTAALREGRSCVIEVCTTRDGNIALHRELQAQIAAELDGLCASLGESLSSHTDAGQLPQGN